MYDLHDEVYYVVRKADGSPLAVPAWMTCPEAAHATIVSRARLPVSVLLELHRVTMTCFSWSVHNVHEEGFRCEVMGGGDSCQYKSVRRESGLSGESE